MLGGHQPHEGLNLAKKPSSVQAFLGSVEGLCLIEQVLRNGLRPLRNCVLTDADERAAFTDLTRLYLMVSEACDRKLKTDLAAQKDFQDLKQRLESGMTNEEIERTLEYHFARKGWGSLDFVRTSIFTWLTENGATAQQATEMIDECVPRGDGRSRTLPIQHKLRKAHERMEQDLEAAAVELSDALGGDDGQQTDETLGNGTGSDSDSQGES